MDLEMSSFFSLDLENHLGPEGHLMKLSYLLDWDRLGVVLQDVHSSLGPEGYDAVQMFKCLLLQSWYSLSDPGLEQSLRVRLDFLQFTGFSVGDKLPDETTFCRFRNKLVKQGKFELLLSEVNRQLEEHGLKVKHADEAIVDATLIPANTRPRKVEGFIDKTYVTPANLSETKQLEIMIEDLAKKTRVKTDKGFFSAANKAMLKERGLKNGIMYKAARNRPLTKRMKQFNSLISKTRWRIEQCFATIKRRLNFHKASYFTTPKVDAQFTMKAICLNLLKAVNKIQIA